MNLYLIPTLLIAAVSVAGAAALRRAIRREYSSWLPWLPPWGALCTIPALLYLCLCIPDHASALRLLDEAGFEPGWEMFAGAAGVLPGLMWDAFCEHREKHPDEASAGALRVWLMRSLMIAALAIMLAIPYGFVFAKQETAPSAPHAEAQETVPTSAPSAPPDEAQENVLPSAE